MKKVLFTLFFLGALSSWSQSSKTPVKPVTKTAATQKSTTVKKTGSTSNNQNKPINSKIMTTKPDTLVKISTIHGDMLVKLYDNTPLHKANFLKLVQESYYDGTIFHRVIGSFMIQGGDPDSRNPKPGAQYGTGGPSYTVPAEFRSEYIHKKGALSAARMGDQMNPMKASSGSQFYIVQGQKFPAQQVAQMAVQSGAKYTAEQLQMYANVGGTPFLDNQYTVFGEVIEGLDVIDKIAAEPTNPGDRPKNDIIMKMTLVIK